MNRRLLVLGIAVLSGCNSPKSTPSTPPASDKAAVTAPAPTTPWELDNPVVPLPKPPLGTQADFATVAFKITPEKVRLGRWLYFDTRLSADNTVSCASCHHPENAFSELTPHSTGIRGQQGARKAPTSVNGAWPLFPNYFWDGRAGSLIEQAKGPIANPLEMGNTHEKAAATIAAIGGYKTAFKQVWGDDRIDIERVAEAIAAYEATRMSGNSPYDRYDAGDKKAISEAAARGRELFYGKAACSQCHLSWNFSDSQFHNLGVGWDAAKGAKDPKAGFTDVGRAAISKKDEDTGAFKTPTVRDVSKHAPYMHDGSLPTLKAVVEHYNRGGDKNPWLSKKIAPLGLTPVEIDQVVAFMESLDGQGYQDTAPKKFPE